MVVMFSLSDNLFTLDSFKGNTLIVPAISVGNVGQLACDLLISSLGLARVGFLDPTCFLPLVGNNPYTTSTTADNAMALSLSAEVYHNCAQKLTVVQLRSPLVKGKQSKFCKHLLEWMKECEFVELIILSSCHAFERSDEQLIGLPFRYLLSPSLKAIQEKFVEYDWKALEERNVGYGERSIFLPGGGFTKNLFKDSCDSDIPVAVLLLFCAEGNNIPEAMSLVEHLNRWKNYLDQAKGKWTPPISWSHLFGNTAPSEIF